MGQLFSNTTRDGHQDLLSSFSTYLKNVKGKNQVISQEIIDLIQQQLSKGNIEEANATIKDALQKIERTQVNVAVTGETGAGKSSFINAIRGVSNDSEQAATTGVTETTMERTAYQHPNFPNVILWDLPGIGTTNFQPTDYLEKVKFIEYDFFIIISATRFRKNDVDLARAIRMMKKDFYFVRTKVDSDLRNEEESKPNTFERERVLQQIRDHCVNTFTTNNIDVPQIFLIDNIKLSEYDFSILMDILIRDLPAQKRYNFILALPNISTEVIKSKKVSMQQFIFLEAIGAGILAMVPPLSFLLTDPDLKMLKTFLKDCRDSFGVNDESLQNLARDWDVPVEQLEAMLKSPHLFRTRDGETIEETFSEYSEMFRENNQYFLLNNLSFKQIYYLKLYFLDTVAKDAEVLLEEIYSRNNLIST